jgi:hypothetical protein
MGAQGAAQSMAGNRGTALDASLTRDRMATSRGAEDRNERDDAWKKIQQAAYVMNGTHDYAPPTLQTSQGSSHTSLLRVWSEVPRRRPKCRARRGFRPK